VKSGRRWSRFGCGAWNRLSWRCYGVGGIGRVKEEEESLGRRVSVREARDGLAALKQANKSTVSTHRLPILVGKNENGRGWLGGRVKRKFLAATIILPFLFVCLAREHQLYQNIRVLRLPCPTIFFVSLC
jgi:hypothetical protein